jgi:hypothetical protein
VREEVQGCLEVDVEFEGGRVFHVGLVEDVGRPVPIVAAGEIFELVDLPVGIFDDEFLDVFVGSQSLRAGREEDEQRQDGKSGHGNPPEVLI